jgi:hypothetical protein
VAKSSKPRRKRFINILGVKVKIKYTSKVMYDDDTELHGCYCHETKTIHVSLHSDVNATILHEILHGILAISGAGNLINMKTEETIVSSIESGLKDYFKF